MIGDGFDDLIVGAFYDDRNGEYSGASFVVFGGIGDNTLIGNGGSDRLSGSQGYDVFVFGDHGGTTTVVDFKDGLGGQDLLDLTAFGFADAAAVLALASAPGPGGHDVLIELDADDIILLE